MEDFATYILSEEDISQKMVIAYYLSKKTGIFFDKSIVLKTEIARIFIDYMQLDVDKNLVLTACLLANCRKIDNAQKIGKLETFAEEGARYLETLGFSKRFCKICEEINRYSGSEPREKESDILEVVDQFVGLILNRVEREAFPVDEALVVLQERNLKYIDNIYLQDFITFVNEIEKIYIKETIELSVIRKLVNLHNREANVKTFIGVLANKYSEKIDKIIEKASKERLNKIVEEENKKNGTKGKGKKSNTEKVPIFSEDIAKKIMNHESKYKIGG